MKDGLVNAITKIEKNAGFIFLGVVLALGIWTASPSMSDGESFIRDLLFLTILYAGYLRYQVKQLKEPDMPDDGGMKP